MFIHARLAVPMGDRGCLSLFGERAETHQLLAEHLKEDTNRMAKPRKTALKRTNRGYVRNLGMNPDGKGQPKFCRDHDRSEAILRLYRIMYLWQRCTGWDIHAQGDGAVG